MQHFARNGILPSQSFTVTDPCPAKPASTFSKCILRRLCHDWKHHSWSCSSILWVCQPKVFLMAVQRGICLPCFLYLLLTWADCWASVNPHWFSWEWNVITAAGCTHQVHWITGSLGGCVISCTPNVLHSAFFLRRWHRLSELAASSALNTVPLGLVQTLVCLSPHSSGAGSEQGTQRSCGRLGARGTYTKSLCGQARNWAQALRACGWGEWWGRASL